MNIFCHRIVSILFIAFILKINNANAQILGGGTTFATAVTFNQSWLVGCPSGGTALCNTVGCEPTTAMDPCAPAPSCATGTTGSDVWFKFFAQSSTASITVNSTSAFDIAIQAFSGSACPGLTQIGCADLNGNNQPETVNLTGLTPGAIYHFRIFGATTAVGARTGNYNFCGSTGLGSTPLPVTLTSVKVNSNNGRNCLQWVTETEQEIESYTVEYSVDGQTYKAASTVSAFNSTTSQTYNYCDAEIRAMSVLYRLRITEFNGKIYYSAVVKAATKAINSPLLFPNPAHHSLKVLLPQYSANISYQIIDVTGRLHLSGKLPFDQTIPVQILQKGVYYIILKTGEGVNVEKFEKL